MKLIEKSRYVTYHYGRIMNPDTEDEWIWMSSGNGGTFSSLLEATDVARQASKAMNVEYNVYQMVEEITIHRILNGQNKNDDLGENHEINRENRTLLPAAQCKYLDNNCTVTKRQKSQSFPCEFCHVDLMHQEALEVNEIYDKGYKKAWTEANDYMQEYYGA